MKLRPDRLLSRLLESLWFVPSALTLTAAVLAYVTVEVDRRIASPEALREIWLVFDIGADGARSTLSAIATSVITVTGVVFSVTIVALQLAATQFTPRVLRTFLADRGNQWVLGIFIATFTYTLLVQQTVGTTPEAENAFVPRLSVTISIALVLVSIGGLIFFVNHIAQSIRASVIIEHVTADARNLVEHLFPEEIGEDVESAETREEPPLPQGEPYVVRARRGGYLDSIDADKLLSTAEDGRLVIRMEPAVGEFVLPGEPLASLWFDDGNWDEERVAGVERKVAASFVLAGQWTLHQDLERGLVELTDIAVRALSPSLNDPTTAAMCVDRLGEVLSMLGRRRFPSPYRTDSAGRVRFIATQITWERAVEVSFEKFRVHATRSPAVLLRAVEMLGRLKRHVPPHRLPPLDVQIRELREAGRRSFEAETDRRR
ncbi:MAG: DUF2254 domain-containing protein, partial [Gemmatimonadota bacterium]